MSIKEMWHKLKHWQMGGVIGVIIGIIYFITLIAVKKFLPEDMSISLLVWLSLPIIPSYVISYVFFGDKISGYWHMLFESLLTFGLLGIAFGQGYYQWKVSKEPFWSSKNRSLLLIAFLILILLITLILLWMLITP